MSQPFNLDAKSVLVDKLGENPERFAISNLIFKNHRGLTALFEIRRLKAELLDFAKDPNIGKNQLGPVKPRQPDTSKMNDEEASLAEQEYSELLGLWELEKKALVMQVPTADMFSIIQYVEPFEDSLHATPAVKGVRFKALTKNVTEEPTGLLANFGRRSNQQ